MKNRLFYNFRKSIKFLGNKRIPYLCSMICCNVIGSICYNIVLAIVMKRVLDAVAAQNMKLFFDGVEIALVSFIIAFLFEPILTKMKNYCVRSMLADMRMEIVNSIISFPLANPPPTNVPIIKKLKLKVLLFPMIHYMRKNTYL